MTKEKVKEKLNSVQKELTNYVSGKQDIIDFHKLCVILESIKEDLELPKEIVTVKIQYDVVCEDVITAMDTEKVIELWQNYNFDKGLADAQFPTYTARKKHDVHIHIMDGDKILNTLIV